MLRHLHIANLALIDDIRLDLAPGMIVLTGESGAGKSLLLDGLSLLAGHKATPAIVRSGADRALVEAAFDCQPGGPVEQLLDKLGIERGEEGEVLLRREVSSTGRTRACVNGRMVPVAQLAEVAGHLLHLGSQHEQQALLAPAFQRDLLDEAAAAAPLRARHETAWRELQSLQARADAHAARAADREQRLDFLRYQLDELESAGLTVGEQEELEAERARLAHVEDLQRAAFVAREALSDAEGEIPTALDQLAVALREVEEMGEHEPAAAEWLTLLQEAADRLADVARQLGRYAARLEADPARLRVVEDRLEQLRRLLRKHGPTEAQALARLAAIRAEVEALENWEAEEHDLDRALAAARAAVAATAAELTAARERARAPFARSLAALLRDFAMPKARVEVALHPLTEGEAVAAGIVAGPGGAEEVEILFSANEGERLQPLRRIASGGELSRVMLAVRTLSSMAGGDALLVFDEVDAGISGVAARLVGERLAALGRRQQVLCVTHNPSVAAQATQHVLVSKHGEDGRTVTTAAVIEGIAREAELARLLDGGKLSTKGRALAAEMLAAAG